MKKDVGKMNTVLIWILFFSVLSIFIFSYYLDNENIVEAPKPAEVPITQIQITPTPTSVPIPIETETPYPKPDVVPAIKRPYLVDKSHDIWHASDPASYITPINPWVNYVANKLYIDKDGILKYKDDKVPWSIDNEGVVLLWTDRPFVNKYTWDGENDYWMMPDYYLTHDNYGDCEDWAIAVTSMMLSGKMSLKQGSGFVKNIIPAKVVHGYTGGIRDGWVEYIAYGKTYISTTAMQRDGYGTPVSTTLFLSESEWNGQFSPVFQFNETFFGKYQPAKYI